MQKKHYNTYVVTYRFAQTCKKEKMSSLILKNGTDSKNMDRREFVESILIVDDDPDFSSFLKKILTMQRYHVESVFSCADAFRKISSKKYSLIMIDVGMPDMSGVEFFHNLHKDIEYTELIVMTGSPNIEAAVDVVKEGAFDYLAKPFDNDKMIQKVRDAIRSRNKKIMDELEHTATQNISMGNSFHGYKYIKDLHGGSICDVMLVEKNSAYYVMKIFHKLDRPEDLESIMKKFQRVVHSASGIRHPNVIRIHEYSDAVNQKNSPYMVTEYVPGRSLAHYIGSGKLSAEEKYRIVREIVSALSAIHTAGLLHRDIKPANIILDRDTRSIKVTDFGISTLIAQNYTETENLRGSPAYMAPECFSSFEKIGAPVDIFAAGVLVYELITGIRPFYGENIAEIIASIKNDKPPRPRMIINNIPPEIEDAIGGMLLKDHRKRLTAAELLSLLDSGAREAGHRELIDSVWN